MKPADVSAGILRERFQNRYEQAQAYHCEGHAQEAAEQYRQAAQSLEALAGLRGVDRDADVEELERTVQKLERGEDPALASTGSKEAPSERPVAGDAGSGAESADAEFRGVAESFIATTDATWTDIGGLDPVVRTLKRSIVLGAMNDKPAAAGDSKGVLFHGPPGTGKTLLAAAVAGSLDTTFFEVNTGDLLSKYFGESSKQISALFEVARELAPSVVFLDEVDALTTARDDGTDGAARRVLDTLLSELDGLEDSDAFVLPLASTNTPWDLDRAVRRRFEQRIHVPLPDQAAATEIVRIHTVEGGIEFATDSPDRFMPAHDPAGTADCNAGSGFETPAAAIASTCVARGFSGHDIEVLCKEAVNRMLYRKNRDLEAVADAGDVSSIQEHDLTVTSLPPRDVRAAFETVSPSLADAELSRFEEWHAQYGTTL